MKKIIALLLAAIMLLSLAGCGADNDEDNRINDNSGTNANEEIVPDDAPLEDIEPGELKSPVVIFDKDNIVVSVTSVTKIPEYGEQGVYRITLEMQNGADCKAYLNTKSISINGITIDDLDADWPLSASAGETRTNTKDIRCTDLAAIGISEIRNIKCDHVDLEGSNGYNESFSFVLDCGDLNYKSKVKNSGNTIYDQNGIKLIYKGVIDSNIEGNRSATILVINKTDRHIRLDLDDIMINGIKITGIYGDDDAHIYSSSAHYNRLSLHKSTIEAVGGKLGEMSFTMSIWDLFGKECFEENIEISFELQ